MIAVDTNMLIRLLTNDDSRQVSVARAVMLANPIWIAKTVLLETAWVLDTQYHFEDDSIREAFTHLLGHESIHFEDESQVVTALALNGRGVDFADAFHLASRPSGVPFVSFDKAFIRAAKRAGITNVSLP